MKALFEPLAQGTVRFLGERAYFLALPALFGLNPLPFRVGAFLVMFASLGLLASILHRATGSVLLAGLAPLLWLINSSLAPLMVWSSPDCHLLCGLLLLASLWQLQRYMDTGQTRYGVGQWLTFLAAFGTSELPLVYPAVAAAYCLCLHRRIPRSVLALWLGSALFLALQFTLIHPGARTGLYAPHFDAGMMQTFLRHAQRALGPGELFVLGGLGRRTATWLAVGISVGLVLHVWRRARRRDLSALFWLAWFVLLLAPVLPLRDHVVDYYPAVPSIGLGVLAAGAIAEAWRDPSRPLRLATAACVGVYAISSPLAARELAVKYYNDSVMTRCYLDELRRIHDRQPGAPIVVETFARGLFAPPIPDAAARLFGVPGVRVLPPAECAGIHREQGAPVYRFDGRNLVEERE